MKVTYATDFDFKNINNWSGLGYYYGVMLKNAGFELDYLNNINTPFHTFHVMKRFLAKRIAGEIYSPRFNVNVSKNYARTIENRVSEGTAILSPNTVVLANVHSKVKRVLYADATFERLINFYQNYANLSKRCKIEGDEVDRLAVQNCDLLIYSSQWAADSAINYYKADPRKVFIAPYGANLEKTPDNNEVKSIIKNRASNKKIHLLFLGVDWIRKGGSLALEVVNKLKNLGFDVVLHIVGITTKVLPSLQHTIVNHGFIKKDSVDGQQKMAELFSLCNFMLLPTLADCTPVSFSEANAFGLPVITTNVGGNSCIIQNDVNGKVIDLSNFVDEAVEYIARMMGSHKLYEDLCFSSYDKYRTELNWTTTGNKIYKLINSL